MGLVQGTAQVPSQVSENLAEVALWGITGINEGAKKVTKPESSKKSDDEIRAALFKDLRYQT